MRGFTLGLNVGEAAERRRHEEREQKFREREEQLMRLADASEADSNGDPGPMNELMREWGYDDLLDVASEAGVTPPDGDREERNFEMAQRMIAAAEAGPDALASLADEWGLPVEELRKTPIDCLLDAVEAARLVADLEAWLRDGGQC